MSSLTSNLRRTVWVPSFLPLTVVAAGATWLGVRLAGAVLGGNEGFVAEVRDGALLFAALLVLSLAEPLEVGREARTGLLGLRLARGRRSGLAMRCVALALATVPAVLVAALVGGGLPERPVGLCTELLVVSAIGLALGSFLDRLLLVPALWGMIVVAHLRPWLEEGAGWPLAWLLPRLGDLGGPWGVAHGLVWAAAMLALAEWRVTRLVERGA